MAPQRGRNCTPTSSFPPRETIVGLVRPDGTPEGGFFFLPMQEDVLYGYASIGETRPVLLSAGAPCSAHVPTSAADAAGWREPAFDDSGWMHGTMGVGFDTLTTYDALIGLDTITLIGVNASVYIRVSFVCTNVADVQSLTLKMKYDDGFAAYLNGTEVQTANFEGTPEWNSRASIQHTDSLATLFNEFDLRVASN